MSAAAAQFTVRIPDTWVEFDVWRATRTGDLARMVDARIAEDPRLRPHRSLMVRALRKLAEDAERSGAVYAAAALDDLGDDGRLVASLAAVVTEGFGEPALNTVDRIAAQITTTPRTTPEADWREVRLVDLPAGRAVRVQSVTTTGVTVDLADDGPKIRQASMQTLVPVPHSDAVLNLVLTSTQVWAADALLDLFDAISSTLAWQAGPDPRQPTEQVQSTDQGQPD